MPDIVTDKDPWWREKLSPRDLFSKIFETNLLVKTLYNLMSHVKIGECTLQRIQHLRDFAGFNNLNTFFPQREHKLSLYCELSNERKHKGVSKGGFYHEE
ncbi:hypothetical protein ACTQ50_17120 [Blautia sp. Sow4_E7]|uniref:hypothetical protein n=1 Tax=Blautia sp. Sow4_E7 TaxID=3438749 RepID=UPI003F92E781